MTDKGKAGMTDKGTAGMTDKGTAGMTDKGKAGMTKKKTQTSPCRINRCRFVVRGRSVVLLIFATSW